MEQPDLFSLEDDRPTDPLGRVGHDRPAPTRTSDPETSHQAAATLTLYSGGIRRRVYDYLLGRAALGATDLEGIQTLEVAQSTYRGRRSELCTMGLVADSGRRKPNPLGAGCQMTVWVVVCHGCGQPCVDNTWPISPIIEGGPERVACSMSCRLKVTGGLGLIHMPRYAVVKQSTRTRCGAQHETGTPSGAGGSSPDRLHGGTMECPGE
jgi:hypothetical protein